MTFGSGHIAFVYSTASLPAREDKTMNQEKQLLQQRFFADIRRDHLEAKWVHLDILLYILVTTHVPMSSSSVPFWG